ncbi:MAG: amidohydrolase family protein [Xanthomonadaceae bacterium]|nr:amidohydrolase family protein [Xanthomonadaceae bacterium]
MSTRYLISAPWVMPRPGKIIANGAVLIEKNQITQVAPANEISAKNTHDSIRICQKDCLLMPGLVNAHCHLELTELANLCPVPGTVDFIDWIISVIAVKKVTPAETFRTGLATGQQLLLESGTTCVGDLRSPEIFQSPGTSPSILRAIHFLEIIGQDPRKQVQLLKLLANEESIAGGKNPLVQSGIAPHTPYTVSLPLLKELIIEAEKRKLPVTIHMGESVAETRFFHNGQGPIAEKLYPYVGWQRFIPPAYGKDSIDLLLGEKLIHNLSAVHLGTARQDQLRQFAQLSIKPIICLRSNQALGNPLPDLPAMFDVGLSPALGTDSLTSVNSLSLWDEMRFMTRTFPGIPANTILTMATINGAAALGLENSIGRLEAGYEADLIAVRIKSPQHSPDLEELIQNTENRDIRLVMVGGKIEKSCG